MSKATDNPAASAEPAAFRFRVHLACPTPLRNGELLIQAASESDAWSAFCHHNGISDSDHPRTIERV